MTVTVNGIEKDVPFFLSDIPLGKYIDFQQVHGRRLQKELDAINAKDYTAVLAEKGQTDIKDEDIAFEKQLDIEDHIDNEALAWYGYWTEFDFFEARKEPFILPVLAQFRVLSPLLNDVHGVFTNLSSTFEWKGEEWKISNISEGETIALNAIAAQKNLYLHATFLKRGHWSPLLPLCAAYVRKKDELFKPEFIQPESERMELMKELPMDIAMCVALLIKDAVNSLSENYTIVPTN